MVTVYCYSRCTTCLKALQWLDKNGIAYELIDIRANHPDEETLRKYYAITALGLQRLEDFKREWKELLSIYRFVTKEEYP